MYKTYKQHVGGMAWDNTQGWDGKGVMGQAVGPEEGNGSGATAHRWGDAPSHNRYWPAERRQGDNFQVTPYLPANQKYPPSPLRPK